MLLEIFFFISGAHFLEQLSRKFDDMMQSSQPVEDKTLDNLVSCLALLYSFKVILYITIYIQM